MAREREEGFEYWMKVYMTLNEKKRSHQTLSEAETSIHLLAGAIVDQIADDLGFPPRKKTSESSEDVSQSA